MVGHRPGKTGSDIGARTHDVADKMLRFEDNSGIAPLPNLGDRDHCQVPHALACPQGAAVAAPTVGDVYSPTLVAR
jgi:hypothetical protein